MKSLSPEKIDAITNGGILKFAQMKLDDVALMPISSILPSQIDDNIRSVRKGPIEVALVDGLPVVIHGNHRYYNRSQLGVGQRSIPRILVKRVENPYKL